MYHIFSKQQPKNPQDVQPIDYDEREEYITNDTLSFQNPFYQNHNVDFGNTTYEEFVYEDSLPKYNFDPLGMNSLEEEKKESSEPIEMMIPFEEEKVEQSSDITEINSSLPENDAFEKSTNSDTESDDDFPDDGNSFLEIVLDFVSTTIRTTAKIMYYHFIAGIHFLRESFSDQRLKKA